MKLSPSVFRSLIFLFFSLSVVTMQAQEPKRVIPDSIRISLLTCASGEEIYSLFGHTAIRYENYTRGIDAVFNYAPFPDSEATVFGGCCPCGNEKHPLSERYGLPQKLCGVAGSAFRAVRNGVRCEYGYSQVSLFPVFVEPAQGFVHCGKGTGV